MATLFSVNNNGIDLSTFDLATITSGLPTVMTTSDYKLPNAEFKGPGDFTYTGNSLTGGTISEFIVTTGGAERYHVTGLFLPVTDVDDFLATNDSQGFLGAIFSGADTMLGSDTVADHLIGFAGNDTLEGNGGNDTLDGSGDNDRLDGNDGNDSLIGGAGNDTLDGGAGDDSMDGGEGSDQYFVDSAKDVTTDTGTGLADVDTVNSTLVTTTIADSIENLTLLDTAVTGNGNAGNNVLIGDDLANNLDGKAGADTMQGGKGDDFYFVDDVGDKVIEASGQGVDQVNSSVTFTLPDFVENLVLTGDSNINGTGNGFDNILVGNDGNNSLNGGAGADTIAGGIFGSDAGDDTIDGGAGNDRMIGRDGDDTYIVDSVLDTVIENPGEGVDTIKSSVSYTLPDTVEILELTGVLDINGTGTKFGDLIIGNTGNNILDGKGDADSLQGGDGNDTYIVDNTGDKIVEDSTPNSGHDTAQSSVSFSLATNGANVEDLVLTGKAAINGTGNDLDNKLTGNTAANKLDGGLGADTMIGGAGDDSYVVDNTKDVVTEAKNGGNDEVFVTGNDPALVHLYTEIEHYNFSLFTGGPVTFTGTAAANRITGTAGNDSLAGLAGNDTLDGGPGDDTMDGGTGNDTYIIDTHGDRIVETGKDTGDTVQTGVAGLHINLSDSINGQPLYAGVENVTFTGSEDLNATGTDLGKNVLTGNAGDNLLSGLGGNDTLIGGAGDDTLSGGAGADSMAGGTGDDTYLVDSKTDKLLEKAGEGNDLVVAALSYILGDNLEQLVLQGGDLNGTGNALANIIIGTDGKNVLDGKAGEDTLAGHGGDDTYIVDNKNDAVVEDKDSGHDLVKSTTDFTLSDNVEDLTLLGVFSINGTGNDLDNLLIGNAFLNPLDGGIGADTLRGGASDDTYIVDNTGDVVVEKGGSGNDLIIFQMPDQAGEQAIADRFAATPNSKGVLTSALILGVEQYDFSKFINDVHLNIAGDGANNKFVGTKFDDTLTGNAGNDTLDGGPGGIDSMTGGAGNDTIVIDSLDDKIVELKNGGTDTIVSELPDYTLQEPSLNYNFENLTLADGVLGVLNGTGNSLANLIRGNGFGNELTGGAGNDTFFGEEGDDTIDGGAGNDSMLGGFGNDTYILDSKGDKVVEADGLGVHDKVIAPFDYTLGANVEDLTLVGTAIKGTGNNLNNIIIGNDLDNILDGKFGFDSFAGGAGNDTYILNSITDTVTELPDEGNDTIKQSWNLYILPDEVENLIFTTSTIGGKGNDGTGNASDNLLVGNSAADTLVGSTGDDTLDGGAGADSLVGGADNDTYIVDNAKDVVQEFGPGDGGGIDTIQAKISIDLANYKIAGNLDAIENVTLTGSGALSATGNGLDNHLIGNAGANKLIGLGGDDTLDGGKGGDNMIGGAGNDTYVVDSTADKVDETGGTGTDSDTVLSSITFNLTANGTTVKGDLENLTLTGTGNINGTGNGFNNVIEGNAGINKLDGGGGDDTITGHGGNDQIDVGNGNDTVRYTGTLDGHDVISNFDGNATGGQDTLDLDGLFDSLSIGAADRAGRVTVTPGVGAVDVSVDCSVAHDGSNVITVATLNTTDAITVGQDVLVGT